MGWVKDIYLVVPVGGPYDLSEYLENRRINSVTVEGITLVQNAKAGSKELINVGGIGPVDEMFQELSTDGSKIIGRSLVDKPILSKRDSLFVCDDERITISANSDIATDPSKSFNLFCSIHTQPHPIIRIQSGEGYNAVILKFDLGDVIETKKEDQPNPVEYKNTILIPIYFDHKDGKIRRIMHQDIVTLLKENGYEIDDHKIAFVPDTRVIGILGDKVWPLTDDFRYWSPLSGKIESNEFINPYESTDTLIIPTENAVYEYHSNRMDLGKAGTCYFAYTNDGEPHRASRYYTFTCDINRIKDQVVLRSEMVLDPILNATGILLQVAFEGDPKIKKNPIDEESQKGKEDKMVDLKNKIVIWGDNANNNISKEIGLKPGQTINGDLSITGIFMWEDCRKGDLIYFPDLEKLEVVTYQGNSNFVYSELNSPCWLTYSNRSPHLRGFQRDFKLLRRINGRGSIVETNIEVDLDIRNGDIKFSSTSPLVSGLLLDISGVRIESDKGENIANLTSSDNKVDEDNKSFTIIKEENVMGNKKELFGKIYGPLPSGTVAMDITGQLVMKPYDGQTYKRFDSKSGKIVDMLDHVFKLNNLAYVLPVNIEDVVPDDIVVVSNREFYVVKSINKAKVIKGVNLADSTMLDIIPESLVGSDISFVAKVVNLLNPGKIDPMLMMMVMGDEEDDEMDAKTAALMMMAMNNNGEENNNMGMMLPMLLMDKDGEGNGMNMMLPMMMMNNNQAGGNNMNMMLPLMLMGDEGESDPKDLMFMMMMCGNMQQGDSKVAAGLDMNMLMPMMMLDKGRDKKDLMLMLTILQKQANLERTMQLIDTTNQKNNKEDKQEKKTPKGDNNPDNKEDE